MTVTLLVGCPTESTELAIQLEGRAFLYVSNCFDKNCTVILGSLELDCFRKFVTPKSNCRKMILGNYQRIGEVSAVECLVGAVQLGVGLLQQRAPKLVPLRRVREEEIAVGAAAGGGAIQCTLKALLIVTKVVMKSQTLNGKVLIFLIYFS